MKFSSVFSILFFSVFNLFVGSLMAQDCQEMYAIFSEGAELHYRHFDEKGKDKSLAKQKITSLETEGNKNTVNIEAEIENNKKKKSKDEDKIIAKFAMTCEGDKLTLGIESMISPQMQEQFKDMEIEISGTPMTLPSKMQVGDQLEDANVKIAVKMGEVSMFGTTVNIIERKVEAEETITTPAGTFQCIRLSSVIETKMGFIQRTGRNVEWFAQGVGMVKSETYNKKGKLEATSELVYLKK